MFKEQLTRFCRYAGLRCDYGRSEFRVTRTLVQELRDLPYVEQWRLLRDRKDFHACLPDHSLFLFDTEAPRSYRFLDRPIDARPVEEYLSDQGLELSAKAVREFGSEYEEYLATVPLRKHYTPIRYDHDPRSYRVGIHPAAHIHVGLDNEIRIALRRELSPIAFFLFVVRQMYPLNWERLLEKISHKSLHKEVRIGLQEIDSSMFCNMDAAQLYLE